MMTSQPAPVAIFAADQFRRHAATADTGNGCARHRFDFATDRGDFGNMRRAWIARRIGGVEAIDIRQQHQAIRFHHGGDTRGQPVIVAVADFGGGDRVVLVDDGQRCPATAKCFNVARALR